MFFSQLFPELTDSSLSAAVLLLTNAGVPVIALVQNWEKFPLNESGCQMKWPIIID